MFPQIVYSDTKSSFIELLSNYGTVFFHHQNIQKLDIKILKIIKGGHSKIVNKIFVSEMRGFMSFDKEFFKYPLNKYCFQKCRKCKISQPKSLGKQMKSNFLRIERISK